jgi:[ribosomal protein S5]-alanine N-acetyltransferase
LTTLEPNAAPSPASPSSSPRQAFPVAETPRLLLRRIDRDDLDFFAALFADPAVMQFSMGVRTREESGQWIERTTALYAEKGYGSWGIVEKASGNLIGFCGLLDQTIDGTPEVEVGYRLAEPFWGQGFAPEAAAAVRDLALNDFGLARVIALIDPNNVRSVRVAEKIGMDWQTQTLKWHRRLRVYVAEKMRESRDRSQEAT